MTPLVRLQLDRRRELNDGRVRESFFGRRHRTLISTGRGGVESERLIGRAVINAGVPGETTAGGLKRLDEAVLQHDPRIVLITLGGNGIGL